MSYEQHLSRGLQDDINNTPITDGMIRFSIDQARIFLDLNSERVEFTDFVKGLTQDEIEHLESPLPKMYLSSDTCQLMMYHKGKWTIFGSGYDAKGQKIDTTYIKEIKYDDRDMLVVIYGDGTEVEVSTSVSIVNRIKALEDKVNELTEKIEIIEANQS